MPNIQAFMAWKIDPTLSKFMRYAIVELDREDRKPKETCSIEVKMNSLLCAPVDAGTAELVRSPKTGKMYWGPTKLFFQLLEKSRKRKVRRPASRAAWA